MKIVDGWLTNVKRCCSPFYDERPDDTPPYLLVIHAISLPPNEFGGDDIEALFMGTLDTQKHSCYHSLKDVKVSAHNLIRRQGEIIQFVGYDQRAWHAGVSSFKDRIQCNDFSIGIELEGSDFQSYTPEQYRQLVYLTRLLQQCYPIPKENIVGHYEIAPERKTDPGPYFCWDHYFQQLYSL